MKRVVNCIIELSSIIEDFTFESSVIPASDAFEKPEILYIDDEEDNLFVFKAAFRRFYKVHTALAGAEGLEILKHKDVVLVITDQRMPRMTGVQFLQNLPA